MSELLKGLQTLNNLQLIAAFIALSITGGLMLRFIIIKLLNHYNKDEDARIARAIVTHMGTALHFLLPVFILLLCFSFTSLLDEAFTKKLTTFFTILMIAAVSFFIIKLVYVFEEILLHKYDISKSDNIKERKVVTQIRFLKKLSIVIVLIISLSILFLSIEGLRAVGTGLLSSAGVAGIIIGFAAQRSIANLLAGLQIAFTQPVRMDDAVVLEGEWGWIEEINLTYVVVRIWDWRRLVLPITYFIEKPFQNWTRNSGELLGAVYLYTDFRLPLDDIRKETKRILDQEPLWNRDRWAVQVSEATEHTMQVRILMTANNSPETYDLRCIVREKLIKFINDHYPQYFPRSRVELDPLPNKQHQT